MIQKCCIYTVSNFHELHSFQQIQVCSECHFRKYRIQYISQPLGIPNIDKHMFLDPEHLIISNISQKCLIMSLIVPSRAFQSILETRMVSISPKHRSVHFVTNQKLVCILQPCCELNFHELILQSYEKVKNPPRKLLLLWSTRSWNRADEEIFIR